MRRMPASLAFLAFDGGQGGGGGGQRAAQAFFGGVGDQFEQVPAHHRVAAGENQDWAAKFRQPVDQPFALLGGSSSGWLACCASARQ